MQEWTPQNSTLFAQCIDEFPADIILRNTRLPESDIKDVRREIETLLNHNCAKLARTFASHQHNVQNDLMLWDSQQSYLAMLEETEEAATICSFARPNSKKENMKSYIIYGEIKDRLRDVAASITDMLYKSAAHATSMRRKSFKHNELLHPELLILSFYRTKLITLKHEVTGLQAWVARSQMDIDQKFPGMTELYGELKTKAVENTNTSVIPATTPKPVKKRRRPTRKQIRKKKAVPVYAKHPITKRRPTSLGARKLVPDYLKLASTKPMPVCQSS